MWFCYLYQMRHNQDTSSYRELFQRPDEGPEIWYVADIQIAAIIWTKKKIQGQAHVSRPATQKTKNVHSPDFLHDGWAYVKGKLL